MIYLLAILIGVPIIEIYLFIAIGGEIGVLRTIVIIILTAIAGGYMLKREGLWLLKELVQKTASGKNPSETLVQGVLVMFAGALLLTPGFLTDTVGFLLILPWTRRRLGRAIIDWFIGSVGTRFGGFFYTANVHEGQEGESSRADAPPNTPGDEPRDAPRDAIDAEYEDVTPNKNGDKNE